jgi:hypothetical protein
MSSSAQFDDAFVRFFSRHLVALNVAWDGSDGARRAAACSCFVVEINGFWVLLTAGHILKELSDDLPSVTGVRSSLFDGWAPTASQLPIPFDLLAGDRYVVDEDGFDLGLVRLPWLVEQNLRANRIVPFAETGWRNPPPTETLFRYAVIGLPEQFITRESTEDSLRVAVNPTFVYLNRVEPPTDMRKPFPSFYGRLADDLYNPHAGVSLEGMAGFSGGPIIGFAKRDNGEVAYHLIAVQSAWRRDHRVVVGPLMAAVAAQLDREIAASAGSPAETKAPES